MFVLPLSRPTVLAHRAAVAPQFSRAVERLFDESFDRIFSPRPDATRTPPMDVFESDDAFTVVFDVPGVAREQIKVSVEGRRVTLGTEAATGEAGSAKVDAQPATGEADAEAPAATETPAAAPRSLYRERTAPRYARTVSLPAEVDQAASQARFENGVLTLTLAKKVPAGAAQLHIV